MPAAFRSINEFKSHIFVHHVEAEIEFEKIEVSFTGEYKNY